MKGLKYLMVAGVLVLSSSISIAAGNMTGTTTGTTGATSTATTSASTPATSMDSNWMCTTNASSASTDADKAADDKMAKNEASASSAFNFAASNCRDCTKITCESKSK